MPATWFVKSRGPNSEQDYTWLAAGGGSAAIAEDIVQSGYGGRSCFDLVDDELSGLLLFSDHGRLVLLVTALRPRDRPADYRQRPIRVSLLGVAAPDDEQGCRDLVGVAAQALTGRISQDLPMRYDGAKPPGFSVDSTWPGTVSGAGRGLAGLAERAGPADARESVLAPDDEPRRAALAAELAARYLGSGFGGLSGRIIVLRTSRLERGEFDELHPWRALSPVAETVTELHKRAHHDGEPMMQKAVEAGKEFVAELGAEIFRRLPAGIVGLIVLGGGIAAVVTLSGGGSGGHHRHHRPPPPPVTYAVYAWGANSGGDLGDGSAASAPGERPVGVKLAGVAMPATASTAIGHLAAGADYSLAVSASGQVLAWGSNADGQLGDGTTTSSSEPVSAKMAVPAGGSVSAVSAGCGQSLALTSAGAVYAWGDNAKGRLARGPALAMSSVPVRVTLGRATAIGAGCTYSMALAGGKVYAWGANGAGQLGDGKKKPSHRPVEVGLPAGATRIAAGCSFGLALTSKGLYAWGQGSDGQLGDGAKPRYALVPVKVRIPASAGRVTAIAAGCDHALALTSGGTVLAWGSDSAGQLGVSGGGTRDEPAVVALPPGASVTGICAGADFSLALTSGGKVLAWGSDSAGQLGDGPGAGPGLVTTGLSGVIVAVGAGPGAEHALAIRQPPSGA